MPWMQACFNPGTTRSRDSKENSFDAAPRFSKHAGIVFSFLHFAVLQVHFSCPVCAWQSRIAEHVQQSRSLPKRSDSIAKQTGKRVQHVRTSSSAGSGGMTAVVFQSQQCNAPCSRSWPLASVETQQRWPTVADALNSLMLRSF